MNKVKISVSISSEALEYLKDVAELEDRSISWLVNDLIIDDKKRVERIKRKGRDDD